MRRVGGVLGVHLGDRFADGVGEFGLELGLVDHCRWLRRSGLIVETK